MNLIDIMEHRDCPDALLVAYQKNYVEVGPYKGIVVFRDERLGGGGSAIVVTGEGSQLNFSPSYNFTYHDVGDLRIEMVNESVAKAICRSTDLDRDIEFTFSLVDNVITVLGEKDVL